MRFIYSLCLYLLTPFLLLRLWWKGRTLPAYRNRIAERFCLSTQVPAHAVEVWVHAVSLGEVIAATPLIEALLAKPYTVLVTTMTPTGSERVRMQFGDKVAHQYLPYDLPPVLARFFNQYRPRIGIIMETELWPNLLYLARKSKVPLVLANARLSQQSLDGYLRFAAFFKPVVNQLTAILAQSPQDAQRFIALGARTDIVQVLGNIKFDMPTHAVDSQQFAPFKQQWGQDRVVFIAASTHEDEETQVLGQLRTLQQAIPNILLLIAPRHPERFQKVHQLSETAGFTTGLRSKPNTISSATQVLILDCMGELVGFYPLCDYAFVGGSFVSVGGHNVLEPIAMQVPVFSGNHVHNFSTICEALVKAEAIQLVDNAQALGHALLTLHTDKVLRTKQVSNAQRFLENNRGALDKHIQRIEAVLTL